MMEGAWVPKPIQTNGTSAWDCDQQIHFYYIGDKIHFGSISASSLDYSRASCHLPKHPYLADTLFEALQPKENLEKGVTQNFQFPNPV